jgi:hypothetical protein
MKKAFLTIALFAATVVAYGQGTIKASNTTLTRTQVETGPSTGAFVNTPTTAGLINYGYFVGDTAASVALYGTVYGNSTVTAGIILAPDLLAIAGKDQGSTIWLQVRGWSASFGNDWLTASQTAGAYYGATATKSFVLAPAVGPGTVIWHGSNASQLQPLKMNIVVPEPSTAAIAGIGLASLLIFRRKK